MNVPSDREDRALLAALERLDEVSAGAPDGKDDPRVLHEVQETLALLAYALPPEPPPTGLRERLLAQLPAQPQEAVSAPSVLPFGRRSAAANPPTDTPAARPGRRLVALAALVSFCIVGLGLLIFVHLERQQQTIDDLVTRLELSLDREAEIVRLRSELAETRQELDMINTVAAGLYTLRPPDADSPMPKVRGVMYVCGNHQQWYISLTGLDPAPEGHEYRLWFLTKSGPVQVREFTSADQPDRPVQLRALTMPPTTYGVTVSLEAKELPHEGPQGPVVLTSDPPVRIWGGAPLPNERSIS